MPHYGRGSLTIVILNCRGLIGTLCDFGAVDRWSVMQSSGGWTVC